MILCQDCEYPCCDFCIYSKQGQMNKSEKKDTELLFGCDLHNDEEHQRISAGCGCCDDFHCLSAK